jgi:pimeloyl-ACP methyl ester carboxylesterase
MELNYKSYGVGEPLIILHGLFGMLDNWHSFAKQLSHQNEVFIADLRNHGRSPQSDEHNLALMARDIYDFMADQNLFSAHIMGHSMGGKTAMQFAAYYPGFVRKLIVVDIFPKLYTAEHPEHQLMFRVIDEVIKNSFTKRSDADELIASFLPDLRLSGFMSKNLFMNTDGIITWKFNALALKKHYKSLSEAVDINGKISNKTLIVKGGKSDYISSDDEKNLGLYFSNARVETIPDAGHWVNVDAPEALMEKVVRFIRE